MVEHRQRHPAHGAVGAALVDGRADQVSGQIRLSWLAPASNGGSAITDYVIQRSPNGTTGWATINDGVSTRPPTPSTGLTNGTRYYFRVFARNAAGNASRSSNVANAIPATVPIGAAVVDGRRDQVPVRSACRGWPRRRTAARRSPTTSSNAHRTARPAGSTINDGVSTTTTLHGHRADQRHPLLLPGLRPQRRRHEPGEQRRQRHPAHRAVRAALAAAAPTNVSGQIRLTWVAPPSNGGSAITDYIIQRSPNGTTGWVTINDGVRSTTALHGDRADQRHPLLLPGLRPQRRGQQPVEHVVRRVPRTVDGARRRRVLRRVRRLTWASTSTGATR